MATEDVAFRICQHVLFFGVIAAIAEDGINQAVILFAPAGLVEFVQHGAPIGNWRVNELLREVFCIANYIEQVDESLGVRSTVIILNNNKTKLKNKIQNRDITEISEITCVAKIGYS